MSTLQEWKEVQEEKKDYSNLKIGQLTVNEKNVHFEHDSENDGTDGESGNERSSTLEPWKKLDSGKTTEVTVQEPSRPVASANKLYISPALRASANQVSIFRFSYCIQGQFINTYEPRSEIIIFR